MRQKRPAIIICNTTHTGGLSLVGLVRAIFDYDLLFGRPASPSPSPFWSSEAGGRDFFVVLHTMCACCWLTKSLAATAHAPSTRRHDNSSVFFVGCACLFFGFSLARADSRRPSGRLCAKNMICFVSFGPRQAYHHGCCLLS